MSRKVKVILPLLNSIGLLALSFLFTVSVHAASETTVGGRVVTVAGPFNGAKVHAYASYGDISGGGQAVASADCDKRGSYSFSLPKGEYYFVARGHEKGKQFFAFHGNNPIKVDTGENTWIALLATEVKQPVFTEGETALTGVVTYKGKPLGEGEVILYNPDSKFKGPGLKKEPVAHDGTFRFSVPVGNYVVVAKKRDGAKENRPLKNGELFCYCPLNPIEIRDNMATRIEVPCYPKDDRNAFVDTAQIKPGSFKTLDKLAAGVTNGIKGRVTGQDGKPVRGIIVLAFHTLTPAFQTYNLSRGADYRTETDAHGSYFIPASASGYYYLVARETLGEGPQRGELYGHVKEAIDYRKGTVRDGVEISVTSIVDEPAAEAQTTPAAERALLASLNDRSAGKVAATDEQGVEKLSRMPEAAGPTGEAKPGSRRLQPPPPNPSNQASNRLSSDSDIQFMEAARRKQWQQPEKVVERLHIKPGDTIADIGAGTGYFTTLMAGETGKDGLVYAVDIEQEMVDYLARRAAKEGLGNIKNILGKPDDPMLPAASTDLVFLCNTYLYIADRAQYLFRIKEILKKNGRLVIVSYNMVEMPEGPPMHKRVSPEQTIQEAEKAGFRLDTEHFFLPYQHFLIFEKR